MRRGRTLIFLLLILVIGLAVAYFGIRALQQYLHPAAAAPSMWKCLLPVRTSRRARKSPRMLSPRSGSGRQGQRRGVHRGREGAACQQDRQVPIDQGVVITSSMVADSSQAVSIAGPQWAALIPPGMTAASIPASQAVAGCLGDQRRRACQRQRMFPVCGCGPEFPEHHARITRPS